eukprot:g4211.t1
MAVAPTWTLAVAACCFVLAFRGVVMAEEGGRPSHVVFLLIDDFGFGDASYKREMYNQTAPPPTPHIDELALKGVRLESHYVNKLCSPTRTALLSGRYAYTNGMDDGVIIDGQNIDMPLNLRTIADRLAQDGGWATSAYGKWDCGMTTWGSTPTCRGFSHYNGFYSAASDYFTHMVSAGFDYHLNEKCDVAASGDFTTRRITSALQSWITEQVTEHNASKTFAYVAHEAVHGPLEVPLHYVQGECEKLVPEDRPVRRIYCGMVRAMDESIGNITQTYERLGILSDTLFILTGDNGGIPWNGGNNYPLRGNKATAFEGGVRSIAFASGAGIHPSLHGTVSHEIMHVTDWLPTLVQGIAGLSLADNVTGRPCPACTRPVAPLDGYNQWGMFSRAHQGSQRQEVLLDLQTTAKNTAAKPGNTLIPGSGAIRVGKWKLLHGHQGVFPGICALRGPPKPSKNPPIPIPEGNTSPWCPYGWTPPPRADGLFEQPQPPPESTSWGGNCSEGILPCNTPASSGYIVGHTLLFDVVNDPYERHNVAAENPDVVSALLARLQSYNDTHCGGARCLPDNARGPLGEPSGNDGPDGAPVWTPWRGDPDPNKCDTNRTVLPIPGESILSHFDAPSRLGARLTRISGWCWDKSFSGGGVPPMVVRVSVNGKVVVPFVVANATRAGLPSKTGAPNAAHGFSVDIQTASAASAATISVDAYVDAQPKSAGDAAIPVHGSPACYKNGARTECKRGFLLNDDRLLGPADADRW